MSCLMRDGFTNLYFLRLMQTTFPFYSSHKSLKLVHLFERKLVLNKPGLKFNGKMSPHFTCLLVCFHWFNVIAAIYSSIRLKHRLFNIIETSVSLEIITSIVWGHCFAVIDSCTCSALCSCNFSFL